MTRLPPTLQTFAHEGWLRSGLLEPALHQISLPRRQWYQFALQCIDQAFYAAEEAGLTLPSETLRGAEALDLWLADELPEAEWKRCAKLAWKAMTELEEALPDASKFALSEDQSRHYAIYQFARAVAWSGVSQSEEAADMTAWCAAEGIGFLCPTYLRSQRIAEARMDQRILFLDLCMAFVQEQRRQLLGLLLLRGQRCESAVSLLQDSLQDALFDE